MEVVQSKYASLDEHILLKGVEDEALLSFIAKAMKGTALDRRAILSVDNRFSIDNLPAPSEINQQYSCIVNLRKGNDIAELTDFYSAINEKLELGGKFVTCVETAEFRKERLYKKFPPIINSGYYFLDYMAKRVASKLPLLRNIYFFITAGRNRVLTSVEVLGRLVYCGFEIKETTRIRNLLYIQLEKKENNFNMPEKNNGFFFKMKRTGYQGKIITVYKVRTMNAYSEYLQDYIYQQNSLDEGGKFKDDYRVNFIGNIMRKLWLDELPMVYNLIKGDVKIVGVRPLSKHYLSLYTDELVELRSKVKPGLIPPYYVDLPKSIEEIMESEKKYLLAYQKHPLKTDISYFFSAIANILFKKARSK